ncbi:uncharacterized protein FIESC28_11696 [Fusarium coffeatum]|uniref:Uncharacterized protein n=1 Tax=Fusarium coffeatum TaxID=231269 RepID=A0A366QFR6_9HYPO|nr:uncharacterized protein FIESC28_11696 [Fusarium coffeatum]RBR03774.1 hypothetical protein FIESC28_11696 [Fusarium coffeatum]
MSDNPYMHTDWFSGQCCEWCQTNTWGFDENAFLNAQELNSMDSLHPCPCPCHASFGSHAPVQPDQGNWQTNTGTTMYPGTFQAHPNTTQDNNQGELAHVPCVVCAKRMAKFKPDGKKAKEMAACHYQSNQGTKACRGCSKGGRGCIWIEEESRLGKLAMKVHWAYQRVKDYGGHYTRQDKVLCKWFLEELERNPPPKNGSESKRR